ncbi:MAG: Maf family protein [Candidatus Methylacidiphilales bacterium]|nr:Maf family protein [Candidatus Methylacidiphilales bacterium]
MDLVLASSSPRRQDLLEEAGIHFRVIVPDVDEWDARSHPELTPHDLVRLNARRKAEAVHQLKLHGPDSVILAADTLVVCESRILGKPADRTEAAAMLALLGSRTHEVLTGVAWLDVREKRLREHVARTRVTFRPLDETLIASYLDKVHVLDKAGAYAVQEHGFDLIERVEGSLSNVIGLPMEIVRAWHGDPRATRTV